MRRGGHILVLTVMAVAATVARAAAQRLDTAYYDFPLKNVAGYYSANFGEMRPNHFHSGTDIKTDGVEGKIVVAAADGYVARIFQSPSGYGLALYVAHPNGTTTVYGHLSRFRKDIADYVAQQRHSRRLNRVDLYCTAGMFPVKRGEEIARSGDTGSSGGPHLHYEIRDTRTQKTLNVIAQGVLKPKDDMPPLMMKLHYIEVDTVRGVAMHSAPATYALAKGEGPNYRLKQAGAVRAGRNGYFVAEVSDRKNDTSNTYGIYRLSASVDGEKYFEYRNDGFTFDLSRYCNSVSYYPLQRTSRNEAIRIAHTAGGTSYFYPLVRNRGVVAVAAGERRTVEITVEDDCRNVSTLTFDIEGKPDAECFTGSLPDDCDIIRRGADYAAAVDSVFSVTVPRGALYESVAADIRRSDTKPRADSTVKVLSPAYAVMNRDIPLHKSIGITFTLPMDEDLRPHAAMASVAADGRISYAGGAYADGRLTARTSSFGTFCVAADDVPPVIRPSFADGEDCSAKRTVSFRISDNFSGIGSYSAAIDGRWVAVDYSPKHARATIDLAAEGVAGGTEHTLQFTLTDNCGNRTVWRGTVRR